MARQVNKTKGWIKWRKDSEENRTKEGVLWSATQQRRTSLSFDSGKSLSLSYFARCFTTIHYIMAFDFTHCSDSCLKILCVTRHLKQICIFDLLNFCVDVNNASFWGLFRCLKKLTWKALVITSLFKKVWMWTRMRMWMWMWGKLVHFIGASNFSVWCGC